MMAPRGGQRGLQGAENGLAVPVDILGRLLGSETGPLIVVDASTTHPDEADWLADMEAVKAGATVDGYIGLGQILPGDPHFPSPAWWHVYATVRPNGLGAALADVADGRCTCLAERGEHPHTARGCDIEGCGCRWVPPPITDNEEGRDAV